MTQRETPPEPGLTREDTGYKSGVYIGWYRTEASVGEIIKRGERRGHQAPLDADEMRQALKLQRRQTRTMVRGRRMA